MKPPAPNRLVVATAALLIAPFFAPLSAQAQLPQLIPEIAVENAALPLPDAPMPQTGDQGSTVAGQATTAPAASSSSQQAAPAQSPNDSAPAQGAAPAAADAKQKQHEEAEKELKTQEKQRLLGVMPQFQVVMNGQAVPLSGGQKWKLALNSVIDPFYIGWAFVVGGGLGDAEGSHPGFGWGPSGYFKRVGASYADNVNGALISNALFPQILHQDPRYFRKGTGSIKGRILYAALSTVICRGDNGKKEFNTSNVVGDYVAGAVSNLYYPASDRGVVLTIENGTEVVVFGALGGQLLEFGPGLVRLLHRKGHAAKRGIPAPGPATTAK